MQTLIACFQLYSGLQKRTGLYVSASILHSPAASRILCSFALKWPDASSGILQETGPLI